MAAGCLGWRRDNEQNQSGEAEVLHPHCQSLSEANPLWEDMCHGIMPYPTSHDRDHTLPARVLRRSIF